MVGAAVGVLRVLDILVGGAGGLAMALLGLSAARIAHQLLVPCVGTLSLRELHTAALGVALLVIAGGSR